MPYIKTQQQHRGTQRIEAKGGSRENSTEAGKLKLHVACGKTISTLTWLDSELSCAWSKATILSLSLPFSASFCAQLIILINRTGAPQVVAEPYVMRAHLASHFPISPLCHAILGHCNCNSSRATASSCCFAAACCLLGQFSLAPGARREAWPEAASWFRIAAQRSGPWLSSDPSQL